MKTLLIITTILLFPKLSPYREMFKDRVWFCVKTDINHDVHGISLNDERFKFKLDFRNRSGQTGSHFTYIDKEGNYHFGEWSYANGKLVLSPSLQLIDSKKTYSVTTYANENFLVLSDDQGLTYYFSSGD